ncbi:MAG: Zn-dependent protease [candidate division Zixibacteria bacterium HGW-Zixibacteria-1]|nr:MAG: Zn-dependent protease [candidate division Zixibacteria bacterium HGW-Zixibacteria-1]
MRRFFITCLLMLIISVGGFAQDQRDLPIRPVNTFSIVCYDSATGQFGAAVQSHWFKVGDVIWLEPGIGAVATQSLVEFSYGPLGLAMMRNGKSAEQALEGLLVSDPDNAVRQVAMIDKNGVVATHTGGKCIAEAGHLIGKNYSVQTNLMRNATVWPAMAKAFENSEGDLADKMMAALEAAQNEGGDIRGKQSAAMVVVSGTPTGMPWKDRLIDIRVDDSPEPLVELRRLLNISRAYEHMDKGDIYITEKDFVRAKEEYMKASEMAPGNPEVLFWYAATLVTAGEVESSLPIFKQVFLIDESWRELVPRLVDAELLPDDREIIDRIIKP